MVANQREPLVLLRVSCYNMCSGGDASARCPTCSCACRVCAVSSSFSASAKKPFSSSTCLMLISAQNLILFSWKSGPRLRHSVSVYLGLKAVRVHLGVLSFTRLGFHFGDLDSHLVDCPILVHGFRTQLEVVILDGNLAIASVRDIKASLMC